MKRRQLINCVVRFEYVCNKQLIYLYNLTHRLELILAVT